jgi:hypothetical protein
MKSPKVSTDQSIGLAYGYMHEGERTIQFNHSLLSEDLAPGVWSGTLHLAPGLRQAQQLSIQPSAPA